MSSVAVSTRMPASYEDAMQFSRMSPPPNGGKVQE
jgi:hypothetical protein